MTIISASRRTDIPAHYGRWFANRVDAGWCAVPNPYNPKQVSRVSLRPEDVDAIVFWTRHARPFFEVLPRLDARGYRYYFQYTLTGYGPPLERRTPPLATALASFRELAERLPPGAVVWRYDPIVVGPAFGGDAHRERFQKIASALAGRTNRVVVSLLDVYRKTRRRVGEVLHWGEDVAERPDAWPSLDALLGDLARTALDHGMTMEACAEERDYSELGIAPTRCIDDALLSELFGGEWSSRKDPGQRAACRCVPSRDIGIPDTCPFGCAYCYATRSDELARRRHREHDPEAPALWPG